MHDHARECLKFRFRKILGLKPVVCSSETTSMKIHRSILHVSRARKQDISKFVLLRFVTHLKLCDQACIGTSRDLFLIPWFFVNHFFCISCHAHGRIETAQPCSSQQSSNSSNQASVACLFSGDAVVRQAEVKGDKAANRDSHTRRRMDSPSTQYSNTA